VIASAGGEDNDLVTLGDEAFGEVTNEALGSADDVGAVARGDEADSQICG
jgi:hypothetical protein